MKHLSPVLFTLPHAISVIVLILVLFCFSSFHAEGYRPLPRTHQHQRLLINHFHIARAYSGPSHGGVGHKLIS
ncbi:hypothetical protein SESBI_43627 [Sesbania bispinosa]|nr:hypothetical protein SESBI_43627 [Sesbania bispinosa]